MAALNVIFRNTHNNLYYAEGVHYLLQQVFPERSVRFRSVSDLSHEDADCSDIIILDLCRGEEFLCHRALSGSRPGLLIGLTEDKYQPEKQTQPLCLRHMSFICKHDSPESMAHHISEALVTALKSEEEDIPAGTNACHICPHRDLSVQQKKVVESLCRGMTINQISRRLLLTQTTIYAHKQFVYRRFNLHCNRDLLLLHRQIVRLSRVTKTGPGGCDIL